MRNSQLLLASLILITAAGCCCKRLAPPQIFHPGPTDYQQKRAERFDPYPDLMSGPELDDARPREYQRPMSDVKRIQTNPQLEQPVVPF